MVLDSVNHTRQLHIDSFSDVIYSKWVLLLTGLLLAYSCRQDTGVQQEDLYGKWDIVKAVRNGKETPYLRGGYFIINPDGKMTLNITGEDEGGPYTYSRNILRINDEKDFIVENMRQDSLAIRYDMNEENKFKFYLIKKGNETH